VKPKGRGGTYYATTVKDTVITLITCSIERIFNLSPDLSKFPPLTSTSKARRLYLEKYAHPSKIKK